jgi:eukaryotic-like serine/threonine-protein kinase
MSDEATPDRTGLPLDVLHQIDRICDRFEAAWARGESPRVEDFLVEIEAGYRQRLLRELLASEVAARAKRGEAARSEGTSTPRTADSGVLLGLLAYQTGLIDESTMVAAFGAWMHDKARPLSQTLQELGALDAPRLALLEGLLAEHLKLHGGVAASLAALPAGQSTRERLERLADPELTATLAQVSSATGAPATFTISTTVAADQRFRVLRPHARGGLGAVFVAMDRELNREVALKQILDHHADDPTSRSRFVIEAEITGGLEHPGIVPVYGLGTYGDGRPFYAMRFVRGDSLKEAIERFHGPDPADSREGTTRDLELRRLLRRFTDVCNAIEYAHSRGVVHRDIKPGNVIVGKYGETLVVDWGLAKPLLNTEPTAAGAERPLTPASASGSAETLPGSAMGTPAYMSPEQAAGDLERLGTRSDVYSLGATLYCLLTGKPAFEGDDVIELLRKVGAGDFPPPRHCDPTIDPALEAICLRAMATAPENRYPSCRALADEVERWTGDEPVEAYREPIARRARRWAKRNRTAVSAAIAALVAGVVGLLAVAAVQATSNAALRKANGETMKALASTREAQAETAAALAQSEAVEKFLVGALRSPDPSLDGKDVKVADVLEQAAEGLEDGFEGSDATKGALLEALGESNYGLGLYDRAITLHTKARAARETSLGPDHPDTLESCNNLGLALFSAGRYVEAINLHEETSRRTDAKLGPEHSDALTSRLNLANAYEAAGRTTLAIELHERILKIREAKLGPEHADTLASCNGLALAYEAAGRYSEAIKLAEAVSRRTEAKFGLDHPNTLTNRNNLAMAYLSADRTAEAIKIHKGTLEIREKKLGPDHPHTLASRGNLAHALESAGRFSEALDLHESTLKLCEAKLGPEHPSTLTCRNNLALSYYSAGRIADAIRLNEQILKVREVKLGPEHPHTLMSRGNLALALEAAGRDSEAIGLIESSLKLYDANLGPDHPATLSLRNNLANGYLAVGRLAEAIKLHEQILKVREVKLGPEHSHTFASRHGLASAYDAAGRHAEAITLGEANRKMLEASVGSDHPHTLTACNNLANAYRAVGRGGDAIKLHEHVLKARELKLGPEHGDTIASRHNLAGSYAEAGRLVEAVKLWEVALPAARRSFAPGHPNTLIISDKLASAYEQFGRWPDAELLRREILSARRRFGAAAPPALSGDLAALGLVLIKQAKWAEAEAALRECLTIRERAIPGAWPRFNAMSLLGEALLGSGKSAEAEPLIVGGYEGMKAREETIPDPIRFRLAEAAARVVPLYEAWGKPEQANAWKAKLGVRDLPADVFERNSRD